MAKRGRGRPRKMNSDNLTDGSDRVQSMEKSDEVRYSDEFPEFFKVYIPDLFAESMRIPPDFINKFGENIPKTVMLRMQSGQSWQVDINRINNSWSFQEGWPEFVQENSLEDDDFLTFCYTGNSVLCVKIFTRNGCIKRDNCTNGKPIESLQENEASEPGNCEDQATERNSTSKIPTTRKSVDKNPSFSVILTESYVRKGYMHVPAEFGRLYVIKNKRAPRRITVWIGNKSWSVGLIIASGRIHLSRGWPKFVKDNSFKAGSLCTFQLIDLEDLAFRVTVSK